MDDKLTIFIAITAVAVVLQMMILLGMFLAVRKLAARVLVLADKAEETMITIQGRVMPIVDDAKKIQQNVKDFLETSRPKFDTMVDDAKKIQQNVKSFLETSRPKFDTIVDNVTTISTTARSTVERVNVTVNDAVDRVRLQVIRGDEMVTHTMDRVEETSAKVQHTVMSPVRQVSGIVQAISTGLGTFLHGQKRRNGGPSDEMFI